MLKYISIYLSCFRVEKSRSSQEVEQSSVNQAVRDLLQTEKQERILLDERVSFLTETDKIQVKNKIQGGWTH